MKDRNIIICIDTLHHNIILLFLLVHLTELTKDLGVYTSWDLLYYVCENANGRNSNKELLLYIQNTENIFLLHRVSFLVGLVQTSPMRKLRRES